MVPELKQRVSLLTAHLSETLMTAAILAGEIRTILELESDDRNPGRCASPSQALQRNASLPRPLVDDSTFSVCWRGRSCRLRNTVLFRLAARLARQPNQYITTAQLLGDVWDGGIKSPETIRSTVRNLRRRLSHAGMIDLATAIRGTGGRYGLILDGQA